MEKFLKRNVNVTSLEHCIIKEELIIADSDEEIDVENVDKEIYSIPKNSSFSDKIKIDEHNKSNGTVIKRKRGRPRSRIDSANNIKKVNLDLSKNPESVENYQSQNSSDPTKDEKPSRATMLEIDTLAKKVAKTYCKKCKKGSDVVRLKSRCDKCKTPFLYTCRTCDRKYSTFTSLSFHLKTMHLETHLTYPCSICGHLFSNIRKLSNHRRLRHNIHQYVKCSKCGKNFRRSVDKVTHEKFCSSMTMEKCGNKISYKCNKCGYTTSYRKRLNSHLLEKHTEGFMAECKNCPKVFKTQRSLRRHMIYYCNKEKTLECDYCAHKFYRKDQIVQHIDHNHMIGYNTKSDTIKSMNSSLYKREPRICKYCRETLKRREHMRFHVERCESAPLALRLSSERAKLPDLDAALKDLAISYCVKCQTKEPLKNGIRRCSKCEKLLRFACLDCPKNFVEQHQLRKHLRLKHVRILKFFRCDKCHCSYKREKNLIEHQRNFHLDNAPTANFKCKKCGKEYKSKPSHRKHQIACTEEPKFHCDKCPYKTHFKSSILQHIWAIRSTCIQ